MQTDILTLLYELNNNFGKFFKFSDISVKIRLKKEEKKKVKKLTTAVTQT